MKIDNKTYIYNVVGTTEIDFVGSGNLTPYSFASFFDSNDAHKFVEEAKGKDYMGEGPRIFGPLIICETELVGNANNE